MELYDLDSFFDSYNNISERTWRDTARHIETTYKTYANFVSKTCLNGENPLARAVMNNSLAAVHFFVETLGASVHTTIMKGGVSISITRYTKEAGEKFSELYNYLYKKAFPGLDDKNPAKNLLEKAFYNNNVDSIYLLLTGTHGPQLQTKFIELMDGYYICNVTTYNHTKKSNPHFLENLLELVQSAEEKNLPGYVNDIKKQLPYYIEKWIDQLSRARDPKNVAFLFTYCKKHNIKLARHCDWKTSLLHAVSNDMNTPDHMHKKNVELLKLYVENRHHEDAGVLWRFVRHALDNNEYNANGFDILRMMFEELASLGNKGVHAYSFRLSYSATDEEKTQDITEIMEKFLKIQSEDSRDWDLKTYTAFTKMMSTFLSLKESKYIAPDVCKKVRAPSMSTQTEQGDMMDVDEPTLAPATLLDQPMTDILYKRTREYSRAQDYLLM